MFIEYVAGHHFSRNQCKTRKPALLTDRVSPGRAVSI